MQLLVIRRGGLGDTLLMLPLLCALRREHPGAVLHFAGVRDFAEVLSRYGAIDAAHSSEDLELWSTERARQHLARFDRVIGEEPLYADLAIDPRRVMAGVPFGLQLARQVGLEPRWPDDGRLLPPSGGFAAGPVVLAPGSGGRTKCWPREHWLELAHSLGVAGRSMLVVAGPTEVERDDPRRWSWPASVAFFADGTVVDLAERMRTAAGFVGNDSGPTHLAAVLGVPTIAIFGPTDPEVWAPVGPHVHVLGKFGGALADVSAAVVEWAVGALVLPLPHR